MSSTYKCAVCSVAAPYKCTGCCIVRYCSAEHQKKHWRTHKVVCRPFKVDNTKEFGRFLKASRDISEAANIFSELPLIYGPKTTSSAEEQELQLVPCIGCYKLVRLGFSQCLKCRWPACSTECSGLTDPNLHGMECPILSLKIGPSLDYDSETLLNFYHFDAILPLRCLLLQRSSPKKWQQLMEMESHYNERIGSEYYLEAENRIVNYLQTNFIEKIRVAEQETGQILLPKSDSETIHKICGIIEVNFMLICLTDGQEVSGVYSTGCMLEHSCVPNCFYTFDVENGYKICVKAAKSIKKDEHLKIMYTHILWGTQMRREHLKATKYFDCICERCSDPSELGSYLSALKCIGSDSETCSGYHLPQKPLDDKSDWKCNKCPVQITHEQNTFLMSKMSEEVDNATIFKKSTAKELEMLIDKFAQLLHPHHYHLFALKHSLIQIYGSQPGYLPNELSIELLTNKLVLCNELLEIVTILDPTSIRMAFYTSIILFEAHKTILELEFRKKDHTEYDVDKIQLAMQHIKKAMKVIEIELDTPAGDKLFKKIVIAYDEAKKLLNKNNIIV